MGFSAGGSLAGLAGTRYGDPVANPVDDIDHLSARPAFQALIYGAPFTGRRKASAPLTKDTPPVFLAAGGNDTYFDDYSEAYSALVEAGVDAELHIYSGIPHGFGLQASNPPGVAGWLNLFRDWLLSQGMLQRN